MTAGAATILAFKLQRQPGFIDYLVMWTGGRLAHLDPGALYDFVKGDRAQAWLLGARAHDRPFPYPPSALLLFGPLSRLSFWVSSWVWFIGGAAVYLAGAWRLAKRARAAVLSLICVTPGVVWAGLSGQCALPVGGLAMLAIVELDRRPRLAGAALGVALMLKPTLLLMTPLALLVGGHRRAFCAMGVTCALVVGLSIAAYGAEPWIAWLTVAPPYLTHMAGDPRYRTAIIAPTGLVIRLGLSGWPLTICRIGFLVIGAAVAALVFRDRRSGPDLRLIAIAGGSLLAAPYAMNYETALLAPAAAFAVVVGADTTGRFWPAVAAYVALALAGLPNIGVFAFPVFLVLALKGFVEPRDAAGI